MADTRGILRTMQNVVDENGYPETFAGRMRLQKLAMMRCLSFGKVESLTADNVEWLGSLFARIVPNDTVR